MKRRNSKGSHLGYHTYYVADGGKARITLGAGLLLWRSQSTHRCSTYFGAPAAVGSLLLGKLPATPPTVPLRTLPPWSVLAIITYVPLSAAGKARRSYFSKEGFAYDPKQDLYQCPAGKVLRPKTFRAARNQVLYKTELGTSNACSMRAQCTDNNTGRQVLRPVTRAT